MSLSNSNNLNSSGRAFVHGSIRFQVNTSINIEVVFFSINSANHNLLLTGASIDTLELQYANSTLSKIDDCISLLALLDLVLLD